MADPPDGGTPGPTRAPGWHVDPTDGATRYWDGSSWTSLATAKGREGAPPTAARPADGQRRRRRAAITIAVVVAVTVVLGLVAAGVLRGGDGEAAAPAQVAAGSASACALLRGDVWCWGAAGGEDGEPEKVLESAVQLSAGGGRYCSTTRSGEIRCWGDGPAAPDLQDVVDVAVSSDHACALTADSSVWCWGDGDHGELGADAAGGDAARRVELPPALHVAVAPDRSCAVLEDGRVSCWGDNSSGQLGSATSARGSARPVVVEGVTGATKVAMGSGHTCAVVEGGRVVCWGDNRRGQLGTGEAVESRTEPGQVVDLRGVTALAAGSYATCAVDGDRRAVCWGDGTFGQLGDGRRSDPRRQPVRVRTSARARDVAVGDFHACGVFGRDAVRCWGANGSGQLGRPGPPSEVPRSVRTGS